MGMYMQNGLGQGTDMDYYWTGVLGGNYAKVHAFVYTYIYIIITQNYELSRITKFRDYTQLRIRPE